MRGIFGSKPEQLAIAESDARRDLLRAEAIKLAVAAAFTENPDKASAKRLIDTNIRINGAANNLIHLNFRRTAAERAQVK